MRRTYLILSLIIIFAILYLVAINYDSGFELSLISGIKQQVNVALYTLLVLLGGVFAGAGIVYMFLSVQTDKVKAYKRELEKTSISGENSASRVEVLEAKIQTLEKAFSTVVDERTQLEIEIKSLNAEIENMRGNK